MCVHLHFILCLFIRFDSPIIQFVICPFRLSRMLVESEESVETVEELKTISFNFSSNSLVLFKCLTKTESMHVSHLKCLDDDQVVPAQFHKFSFASSNFLFLQSSPHLSQLLMRLDFNGFYSDHGGKLGSS